MILNFGMPAINTTVTRQKSSTAASAMIQAREGARRTAMTGENLQKATVETDELGRPAVSLEFNSEGAKEFATITGNYAPNGERNQNNREGRQLAIVLDNVVYSAPVIKSKITGGRAQISGSFTRPEANYLRTILNAGSLPAPLKFMGQRFVDPTLGKDAIAGAMKAGLWGVGILLVFMLVYYRFCGFIANIALALDLILLPLGAVIAGGLLGVLSPEIASSGGGGGVLKLPVLTLPGIAGILLTLGMATDGNILVYERIREELKSGKRLHAAIMAGYDRAFLAIFDANVTSIVTAAILFVFGTGLIRGFAVMLTAGLIVSMFTILVVTKLIFRTMIPENSEKTFKMMSFFPDGMNLPFNKWAKAYIPAVIAVCVALTAWAIVKGLKEPSSVFAVDLTGGAKISYSVANADGVTVMAVRDAAKAAGIDDAAPQFQIEGESTFLEIKTVRDTVNGREVSEVLTAALQENFKDAGFQYQNVDAVGSQIGGEMKRTAVTAFVLALLGMMIYFALRFEWSFGVGATVAIVHDIFIAIGIYLAMGNQISLTIVAAVLTIVGYSINDKIVIADRIREELKKDAKMPISDLFNKCINITLSRTVLTSVTTLMTVGALYYFGRGEIRDFSLVMILGIVFGTISTVFISAPVVLAVIRNRRPKFGKTK